MSVLSVLLPYVEDGECRRRVFTFWLFLFKPGPEFQCKPDSVLMLMEFEIMKSDMGMMGKIATVKGGWLECSRRCYMDARCHGFKSYTQSSGDICEMFDYFPLPTDSVDVEEYYQLYCT